VKVGWEAAVVKDICSIRTGKKDVNQGNPLGIFPFFTCAKQHTYSDSWSFDGEALLIAGNGDVGNLSYCNGKFEAYQRTYVLMDFKHILPHFLYYFFEAGLKSMLFDQKLGNTMPYIKKGMITDFPIPLPPLEEQQRIVAILDEAFEGLARARAHAEANLRNARELFESYAASVFQPHKETEDRASSTTVGEVCDIQSGAGFPIRFQGEESGDFPFYKVSDMNLPGNETELKAANHYVSEAVRRELRAKVFPQGCIVFPKVGGAIVTNKKRIVETAGCVDNNVMGLIPIKSKIIPEYMHEWLRAFDIYEFSNKANPPSITQSTVAGWPLRVPAKEEQMQVVDTATALRAETEMLIQSYSARTRSIDDLRQSLLQKAFAGELT
jgi:type I restriction enzyme S subunit